jgi:hypothetical protein
MAHPTLFRFRWILASVVLILALSMVPVRPLQAASAGAITNVCLSGTVLNVTLNALGDSLDNPSGDQIGFYANGHPIVWGNIPADGQYHSITLSVGLSAAEAAAPVFVAAGDGNGSGVPIGGGFTGTGTYNPGACPSGTFFNPNDGRVDPRPGDRLAVYCNTGANPPNVDVWGVLNDSSGRRLFTFTFSDLVKAGAKGITKKVEPLGTIHLSVDANNRFLAVWTGGPAAATGTKDFTKSFTCDFSR